MGLRSGLRSRRRVRVRWRLGGVVGVADGVGWVGAYEPPAKRRKKGCSC